MSFYTKINLSLNTKLNKYVRSDLLSTFKHASHYSLGTIATSFLGFFSLPIFTRFLSPEDFGVLSIFVSYQTILVPIITLNSHAALGRFFLEKDQKIEGFFGTIILFNSLLILLGLTIATYLAQTTTTYYDINSHLLPLVVLSTFIYICGTWYEQILVLEKRSKEIALRNILREYGIFGLTLLLLFFIKSEKYLTKIYSQVFIGSIFVAYYYYKLKKRIKWSFELKHLNYALRFSVPLIPSSLSAIVLVHFDRVMINNVFSSKEAGLYSVALTISAIFPLFYSAIFQSWTPDFYKDMNHGNISSMEENLTKIFNIIAAVATVMVLYSKYLGYIFTSADYHPAFILLPVIVLSHLIQSSFSLYSWCFHFSKKNLWLSLIVVLASILNVILNKYMLPIYGYEAAAYCTLLSYFVMLFGAYALSRLMLKHYYFPLRIFLKPIIVVSVIASINILISRNTHSILLSELTNFILLLVALMTLYRFATKNKIS